MARETWIVAAMSPAPVGKIVEIRGNAFGNDPDKAYCEKYMGRADGWCGINGNVICTPLYWREIE